MVVGGGMALTEAARSCEMDLFPAPISSKKSISFSFMLPFTKILWSLCWITGER